MKPAIREYQKGVLSVLLSAIMFGVVPIIASIAYREGADGISLNFIRSLLALPILAAVLKIRGIPLSLEAGQWPKMLISGILGQSLSALLVYEAYAHVSAGIATTLHFFYPLLVTLGCSVLYREKITPAKGAALALGVAGLLLFVEPDTGPSLVGVVLALLSGVSYAFHIIYMDKSGLKDMYYFKFTFYSCLCTAACAGLFGLLRGGFSLRLTPGGWLCALLVSLVSCVGGITLFQVGVSRIGATTAALFSAFEPITSFILGILALGESSTLPKWLGCALVVSSGVLVNFAGGRVHKEKIDKPQRSMYHNEKRNQGGSGHG